MLKNFLKIKNIILFSIFFISIYSIFFTKQNVFTFFKNKIIISNLEREIVDKEQNQNRLEKGYNKFKNIDEYRKIVIKNKLFLKEENERIILYELNN